MTFTMCHKERNGKGNYMPDYKKMYLTLFKASEEAVNLLITAQRECEELYLSSPEPNITLLPTKQEQERD